MKNNFIQIKLDNANEEVKKMFNAFELLPKEINTAQARAINRTLQAIQSQAIKIAKNEYTAPTHNLKKRIRLEKATTQRIQGNFAIRDKPGIGLINFAPSPAKVLSWKGIAPKNRTKVVSNKIHRSGQRKVYNTKGTPFVAKVNNGKHIFVRNSQNKLERLFGPSLVYALYGNSRELEDHAKKTYQKRLEYELDFILSKKNAK